MAAKQKRIDKLLSGQSDANITYDELCSVLESLGFVGRQKGTSHRKYYRDDVEELVSVQSGSSGKAKAYQVKQVRDIIIKYNLRLG